MLVERSSRNFNKAAVEQLQNQCKGEDPHAMYVLGNLTITGHCVKKDLKTGKGLIERAAALNHLQSLLALGLLYADPAHTFAIDEEAARYYRRAADLTTALRIPGWGRISNGIGVPPDLGQAIEWFQKAAARGEPEAATRLGLLHVHGDGFPHDEVKAVEWFRKAAELGDANGQYLLACRYGQGIGVDKDIALAIRWYKAALVQGETRAACNLGHKCEHGEGL